MANDKSKARVKGGLGPLWRGFRPAVPSTAGAFALTFLFAAMMPMPWIASICWNLYLDTIHPIFLPPLGNGARIGVALMFALAAALLALLVALALTKPAVKGNRVMNQRVAARARKAQLDTADEEAGEAETALVRRRRADIHPDDGHVTPIHADRDLPAGGLGPVRSDDFAEAQADTDHATMPVDEEPLDLGGEMMLADNGDGPELGTIGAVSGPVATGPADNSLDAMVARFEAGLSRRRKGGVAGSEPAPSAARHPANEDAESDGTAGVDLALEAALSTLHRMSRSAVG